LACFSLWGLGLLHSHLRKSSGQTLMLFQGVNIAVVAKSCSLAVSNTKPMSNVNPSVVLPAIQKRMSQVGGERWAWGAGGG